MDNELRSDKGNLDIERLVQVGSLIQKSIQILVDEDAKELRETENSIPSWPIYEAQRNIIAATGTLVELVSEPSMRLMEYSGQYWESRALAIAVAKRIPDLLGTKSLPLCELSRITGVESGKLGTTLLFPVGRGRLAQKGVIDVCCSTCPQMLMLKPYF